MAAAGSSDGGAKKRLGVVDTSGSTEEVAAAVLIQSHIRGYRARKEYDELKAQFHKVCVCVCVRARVSVCERERVCVSRRLVSL